MSFFGEIHTRKKARFYQWIFLLPLWMKLTWRELWSIRSNVLLTFRTIIKSYTMLILYSHTAQRYILWILIWQITHGDAGYKYIVVLLWTDLILKMSDIHTCLSVCRSRIISSILCSLSVYQKNLSHFRSLFQFDYHPYIKMSKSWGLCKLKQAFNS